MEWHHGNLRINADEEEEEKLVDMKTSHLGFNPPTGNGRLAIITGFELQIDRAGANVGDG